VEHRLYPATRVDVAGGAITPELVPSCMSCKRFYNGTATVTERGEIGETLLRLAARAGRPAPGYSALCPRDYVALLWALPADRCTWRKP